MVSRYEVNSAVRKPPHLGKPLYFHNFLKAPKSRMAAFRPRANRWNDSPHVEIAPNWARKTPLKLSAPAETLNDIFMRARGVYQSRN